MSPTEWFLATIPGRYPAPTVLSAVEARGEPLVARVARLADFSMAGAESQLNFVQQPCGLVALLG